MAVDDAFLKKIQYRGCASPVNAGFGGKRADSEKKEVVSGPISNNSRLQTTHLLFWKSFLTMFGIFRIALSKRRGEKKRTNENREKTMFSRESFVRCAQKEKEKEQDKKE